MSNIVIRKAKKSDVSGILNVKNTTWEISYKDFFSDASIRKIIHLSNLKIKYWEDVIENSVCFVAECNGKIVGEITQDTLNEKIQSDIDCELGTLYVLPDFQQKKVGTRLFTAFCNEMKEKGFSKMQIWTLLSGMQLPNGSKKKSFSVDFYLKQGCFLTDKTLLHDYDAATVCALIKDI